MATILVVDDRPINRDFLAALLGHAGHQVIGVGNGVEALAALRAGRPDLVIADVVAPTTAGAEFSRHLWGDPATADIPVISYTPGYRLEGEQGAMHSCGAAAVLAKPAEPQQILDAVTLALQAGALQDIDAGVRSRGGEHLVASLQAAQRLNQRLSALVELGLDLAAERSLVGLLTLSCRAARGIVGVRHAAVGFVGGNGEGDYQFACDGVGAEEKASLVALDPRSGVLGDVVLGGRPIKHCAGGACYPRELPKALSALGDLLILPLRSATTGAGWVLLAGRLEGGPFDGHDEQLGQMLAAQLAQAYENVALYARIQDYSLQLGGRQIEMERLRYAEHVNALSRRLVAVQEEERRRLAAVVHDLISPNLAVAKLHLRNLGVALPRPLPGSLGFRLDDTVALLDDAVACMRDLSADLRPAMLDFGGLFAAVDGYAQQFSGRSGIEVQVGGTDPGVRLPAEVESALFRIAQEALLNCAKHARATRVRIELHHDAEHATLTVSDDGIGLIPGAVGRAGEGPGIGLLTMRERAEFVGGSFRLDSKPGQGTRITVEI